MPVFEAHPIGFVTTVAVTFWYAWLLNHASGSSLITLIAHGTEGGVETNSLWGPGTELERLNFTYAIVWCLVALGLLVLDRRFWTRTGPADPAVQSPVEVQCRGHGALRSRSAMNRRAVGREGGVLPAVAMSAVALLLLVRARVWHRDADVPGGDPHADHLPDRCRSVSSR